MRDKTYSISLTYEELLLIDGKCSEKAQSIVDKAKTEYSFGLDAVCNEILAQSMKTGKLTWCGVDIACCDTCDTKPRGYYTYPRSGRYHRKGEKNLDRPFKYSGIKPNQGFVIMEGISGICRECWYNVYLPKLVKYIIENDLPIEIQKNDIAQTKYKRDDIRICKKCGYEMRENEMGRMRCWFGDGTYPATCPKCNSDQNERTDKWVMTRTPQNDEVRE